VAPITHSIEIARPPEEVFAYLDDLARHGEWQEQLVSVRVQGGGPTAVGTRATETRRIGPGTHDTTYEVTEHSPPHHFAFRAIDGPVRPFGRGIVEPVGDGSRSRATIELDFEGQGMGRLLVPLVRSEASKQVVQDQQRLKERLESGAAAAGS
jgi:uncharacterized protein YndB with AHSA1/START domain